MLKKFLVLCFTLAVTSAAFGRWPKEINTALKECVAADGNIDEDELEKSLLTYDQKYTCIIACATEKIEMFDGAKFDVEKSHEIVDEILKLKGKEYTADNKDQMRRCLEDINETNDDKCEKQHELMMCVHIIMPLE